MRTDDDWQACGSGSDGFNYHEVDVYAHTLYVHVICIYATCVYVYMYTCVYIYIYIYTHMIHYITLYYIIHIYLYIHNREREVDADGSVHPVVRDRKMALK